MSTETRLKPCPFCGGAAKEFERFNANVITCRRCGVKVRQSEMGEGDAAERWNQRATPAAAQPDLTQQTLDDVIAGIPARDAEIEALRKEIEVLQAQLVDRSPEMQRKPVDESPNLQGQQQPVSGADELPAERVLIDGTAYELPSAVAAELLRLHLEILGSEQAQSSGNSVQLDHLPDATKMVEPSGNSGELPDAVRVPLDSLHADAVYLLSRVKQETLSIHDAAQSIRSRIEATCAALAQQDADKVDALNEAYQRGLRDGRREGDDFIKGCLA